LRIIHLDSFYYYAPIPRAVRLWEKVYRNKANKQLKCQPNCFEALLYMRFSTPEKLVRYITESTGLPKYLEKLRKHMRGRSEVSINIETYVKGKDVDEEYVNMLDFLVFYFLKRLEGKTDTEILDLLSEGRYKPKLEMRVDSRILNVLGSLEIIRGNLIPKVRNIRRITVNLNQLHRMYQEYMKTRICHLLKIDCSRVEVLPQLPDKHNCTMRNSSFRDCNNCIEVCGPEHNDDVARAEAIKYFLYKREDVKLYIATTESVGLSKEDNECFSCLAKCLESTMENRVEVL